MSYEQTDRKVGIALLATGLLGVLGVCVESGFSDFCERNDQGKITVYRSVPEKYQTILGISFGLGLAGALIGTSPDLEERSKRD